MRAEAASQGVKWWIALSSGCILYVRQGFLTRIPTGKILIPLEQQEQPFLTPGAALPSVKASDPTSVADLHWGPVCRG